MAEISVVGGVMSHEERAKYVEYLETHHNRKVERLTITIESDGDHVGLAYKFEPVKFERIRRITGYLTGDTSTWNDAKQEELADRVHHGGLDIEKLED